MAHLGYCRPVTVGEREIQAMAGLCRRRDGSWRFSGVRWLRLEMETICFSVSTTSKTLTAFLRHEYCWLKDRDQSKAGILLSAQNSLGVFCFHKCCLFSNSSSIFRQKTVSQHGSNHDYWQKPATHDSPLSPTLLCLRTQVQPGIYHNCSEISKSGASQVTQEVKNLPANARDTGTAG